MAGLAVGLTGQDNFLKGFDLPAGLAEFDGEPIEQILVRGAVALHAEVFGGAHDALAEELLPLAVDLHAGGQRVFGTEEPLREAEAVLWRILRQRRQEARRVEGDLLLLREVGAAVEDVGFARLVVGHHHHARQDVAAVAVEQHLSLVDLLYRGDGLPIFGEDVLVIVVAEFLRLRCDALLIRGEERFEFLRQHALVLGRLGEPGFEGLGLQGEEVFVQCVEVGLELGELSGLLGRGRFDDGGVEAEAATAAGLRGAAAGHAALLHMVERIHPLVIVLL